MGASTYVTQGKGNPDALHSSSHGAGRSMSRSQAKKRISVESFRDSLRGTYSTATEGTLDESPQAYKDIDLVIQRQTDCIEVRHVLSPVLTIKGGGRDEG
jgi:tRNA-splicing ligase RtcB